ncbi:unnamed protein product [Polarella glacialis]|uniref:Uncharacterized protein n=1 Tax=Polarella glacialis TaxID=89957 RepID=A0A813DSI6_POLGL|nr:unnamed protein product [Polarella glacialis]
MPHCWFSAEVDEGPDEAGVYRVSWVFDGGEETALFRQVYAKHVRRQLTGEACGKRSFEATTSTSEEFVDSPNCTLLLQLHWEGSNESWNSLATKKLQEELMPDEVIGGFDWHVIFRFSAGRIDACEKAHDTVQSVLLKYEDQEQCYTHPYVKAVSLIRGR